MLLGIYIGYYIVVIDLMENQLSGISDPLSILDLILKIR